MRHLNRPGHRRPFTITDPMTGRVYPVPQGGDEDDNDDSGDDDGKDKDGSGDDDDSSDDDSSDDDNDDGQDDDSGDEAKFTQADLDAAIDKRIGRERKRHERELKAAKRKAKKEGDGDEDEASAETQKKLATATTRAVKAEARAAAIAAGVSKERAARFVSLADLDDVDSLLDDDGDVDADAVESLVEDTLEEWPEFKPSENGKGKPGASGGEGHKGDRGRSKVWSREEISKLSPKEFEEHQAEIEDQVKRGLVK